MCQGSTLIAISRVSPLLGLGHFAIARATAAITCRSFSGNSPRMGCAECLTRTAMVLFSIMLCTIVLAAPTTAGNVAFVSADAKPGGDGSSWETAFDDLQDALDLASDAKSGITQVWVTAGVYKPDRETGDRDASFVMLEGVALYGGFAGDEVKLDERDPEVNETILSADLQDNDVEGASIVDPSVFDNSFHVLVADGVDATAQLDGFSIVGGTAHGSPFPRNVGGGILMNAASPTVVNCRFVDNKGLNAGAVWNLGENVPSFRNCDFIDNYSHSRGGAIYGRATIIGCAFAGNYADHEGAAVYWAQLIVDSTFVDNLSRVFGGAISADSPRIVDCTFLGNSAGVENGGVSTSGGAILCSGSTEIINCVFADNNTQYSGGGAIANGNGNMVVRDCSFVNNVVIVNGIGGAINSGNGLVVIVNCSFDGNSAKRGGAVNAAHGLINNCVFQSNISETRGGAVNASSSKLNILNSRFLGNASAENGGAIYVTGEADVFLANCLFSGNSASIDGGAIFNAVASSNLQAVNCSVVANVAGQNGGGLFNDFGTADVGNSIFWNNSDAVNGSDEAAQIFNGPSGTLSVNYTLVENLTGDLGGSGNIGDDPLFVDADGADDIPGTDDDDLHLQSGSPCIDAADNSMVLQCVLDLDSNGRFVDDPDTKDSGVGKPPIVDMGSYEFGSVPKADCNYNGLWDDCEVLEQLAPDCNGNMIPDECDIDVGFSEDCNLNGIPDECDIVDFDCNGNGIPDDCDIADGFSLDCNNNGIPDNCDIDDGFSTDCDLNGIPDECDVDCNFNGVPDTCDIIDQTSLDCNQDGVPDDCQGLFIDCNSNGLADECEIAEGLAEDCNKNGIPDECDLTGMFRVDSGALSPIGNGFPQSVPLSNLPEAMSDVTLSFSAISDLSSSSERIEVLINDTEIGDVFGSGASDCPATPDEDLLILTSDAYNELITDGTATVDLIATSSVNSFQCEDGTFVRMTLQYPGFKSLPDNNNNGIPDDCDIPGDLDGDGFVTVKDLLILLGAWGPCADCDACVADIDGDCSVGVKDLLILLANWG